MSRSGSSTGNGAGCFTRRALSGRISHTSSVDGEELVLARSSDSCGRPDRLPRVFGSMARSKRPFDAIDDPLGEVAQTGFDALRYDPNAHDPDAPLAFTQTISPRSSSASSSCRIVVTSPASER